MSSREMGKQEKQNRRNCRHFRYLQSVWFACAFFFSHYLTEMGEEEEEEGTKVLIKMKDCNNSPTTPIVITSIPLPPVFLDVLTRRNDVMHRTV